ncbi:MAG: GH3 auxin-responsive promoter family protein, partial [Candidatus Omnitrophica bacterium]|nr:GH3 auxin-responsive promoter family protein [Candidatus Omnitrophota bacterium]
MLAYLAVKALSFKARAFERATADPIVFQKKILFEYLGRNKKTEFGLHYGFEKIRSVVEYQSSVPMSDCETMRPYIARMAEGQA